jgi:hypothetical protein
MAKRKKTLSPGEQVVADLVRQIEALPDVRERSLAWRLIRDLPDVRWYEDLLEAEYEVLQKRKTRKERTISDETLDNCLKICDKHKENPKLYTHTKLAKMFGCKRQYINKVLKKAEWYRSLDLGRKGGKVWLGPEGELPTN